MTEHDKTTGETCSACGEDTASSEYLVCVTCADEHDAMVRRQARDAALEEARADLLKRAEAAEEFGHTKTGEVWRNAASAVAALKSRPAERLIPEAKVRRVLASDLPSGTLAKRDDVERACAGTIHRIARALGVDLDAGTANEPIDWAAAVTGGAVRTAAPMVRVPDLGVTCDCNGVPHLYQNGCPDTDEAPSEKATEEERCPEWTGDRPARTDGLSGEAAMVADGVVPTPRKDMGGQWTLRIYDRKGDLQHKEIGPESLLRRAGSNWTTVKGQKSWMAHLDNTKGHRVATCKRGVWKEVKP